MSCIPVQSYFCEHADSSFSAQISSSLNSDCADSCAEDSSDTKQRGAEPCSRWKFQVEWMKIFYHSWQSSLLTTQRATVTHTKCQIALASTYTHNVQSAVATQRQVLSHVCRTRYFPSAIWRSCNLLTKYPKQTGRTSHWVWRRLRCNWSCVHTTAEPVRP